MTKYVMKCAIFLLFSFLVNFAFGQATQVKGISVPEMKGIVKTVSEVTAYEVSHPIPFHYKAPLLPELHGPRPKGQNPDAKAVSKYGELIPATDVNTSTVLTTASQPVHSNFLTIWGSYIDVQGRESASVPPDNCGDVGNTQIVATANTRLKVFNKPSVTGTAFKTSTGSSTTTLSALVNINLNVLFSNAALGIYGISDPHVRYDRLMKRWFVVAIDVSHQINNYCCIAVSSGSTITGSSSFTLFYFNVSKTSGSSRDFFDFPTLGIDKFSLNIGGNMFAFQSSFSGCSMWVINKAKLLAGTLSITSFPYSITNTDMYSPQGVHKDDAAATTGYFVGSSQTFYSKLVIRRVSYSTGTPVLSGDLNLTTSTVYSPRTVPTKGGIAIDGGDYRLYAAMIQKNKITQVSSLWIAQGTLINKSGIGGSGGDRNGILWLEIGSLTSTPKILQSAYIYDGVNTSSSAVSYIFPTIAASGQGHSIIGFTSAGPAKYAQAGVSGRYRTDIAGAFHAAKDFTTSTSSYNPWVDRWGDFTQTVVDPNDDMTMWTFTQYTAATNSWGVRAAQLKAPPPATPKLASTPLCGSSTVTINGTSSNNSGFFDPGSDAGGPGFTRLQVTVKGPSPVTVSSVVFVSPIKITAKFTLPSGALAGTYKVYVINPDKQKDSTTFTLAAKCPSMVVASKASSVIVQEQEQNGLIFKVYPNPTDALVNVEIPSKTQQRINVEVFDITGRKVQNESLMLYTGVNEAHLSISGLAAGLYIIQFKNDKNIIIQKAKVIKK